VFFVQVEVCIARDTNQSYNRNSHRMVFRFDDRKRRLTRHDLADPHRHMTLEQRLAEIGAPDLRDNARVTEGKGDYATILPIDPKKSWGPSSRPLAREHSAEPGGSQSACSEKARDLVDEDDRLSE
jgi:hypothetical protein